MIEVSYGELEEIFKNRLNSRKKDWEDIKTEFIEAGLENIVSEDLCTLTFHVLYNQIISFTDEEIFNHLTDEI